MVLKNSGFFKVLSVYLSLFVFLASILPQVSFAYVVNSSDEVFSRKEDMARAQRVLESKVVASQLEKLGLTKEEVNSRLDRLSDEDLHQFATRLDSIYPGGGGFGAVIAILIIVILVIVVLQLTGHKIIVEKTGK
jgi:hypothetical protein